MLLAMLPRVFSVMVTQRRSGFESRNIRFEGQHSHDGVEGVVTTRTADHSHLHSSDQDDCVIAVPQPQEVDAPSAKKAEFGLNDSADRIADEKAAD
jgi:hypothetical protein